MKAVIFDIDGTLANCEHRQHHLTGPRKDWDAFYAGMADDKPRAAIVELACALAAYCRIIICTGRPHEYRALTESWLREYGVPRSRLFMRADGDHRDDVVVKREMLAKIRASGFDPIIVVDDRKKVVDMWRAEGLTCLQCAEGDF